MMRKLHKSDLPQLVIIEEASQSVPWSDEAFRHCFEAGYQGFALEQEKEMLGFIITSVNVGEAHILNLCIDRPYQRKGYGRQLLEFALAEAVKQGAMIAYLEVRKSNTRAIRLYQNMGFIQIGQRKDYYPVPTGREDALIFAKDLFVR